MSSKRLAGSNPAPVGEQESAAGSGTGGLTVPHPLELTAPVDPETLRVERGVEGARVVGSGGWVATFADTTEAARYITRCLTLGYWPAGRRIETGRSADTAREELAAILRGLHPPVEGVVAGCNCVDCEAKRGK